jgi:hypothetical protein
VHRWEDVAESECVEHGLDLHVITHEAGHAVAALRLGIPFLAVQFHQDDGPALGRGRSASAQVVMGTDDPTVWVQPRPESTLRFLLAGAAAEQLCLGHAIDGSSDGDFDVWRTGMNLKEPLSSQTVVTLLGMPLEAFWEDVVAWMAQSVREVTLLVSALERSSTGGIVTEGEIRAHLA